MDTLLSIMCGIIIVAIGLAIAVIAFLFIILLGAKFIGIISGLLLKDKDGKTRDIS